MIYGDNQTRHFYVVKNSSGVEKVTLADSNKFRLKIHESKSTDSEPAITATSDVINKNSVKRIKVSTPEAYKPKEWRIYVTDGTTAGAIIEDAKYNLCFSAENIGNAGTQSRLDRVLHVTATSDKISSDDDLYIALAKELYKQVLGDTKPGVEPTGALNDEIEIGILQSTTFVNVKDFTTSTTTATCLVVRHKEVTLEKSDIVLHNYPPYVTNINISGNCTYITVDPETQEKTYHDIFWITDAVDSTTAKQYATEEVRGDVTLYNGDRIFDMEHYFQRNRGDMYDLNPDFYTSILNKLYAELDKNYVCVDVDYSFGDSLGFSYHSDKNITFAVIATESSDFATFAKATANDAGALVKVNVQDDPEEDPEYKYYFLPEGHTANADFEDTVSVEISVTEGSAYQIAELFK